jgi:hypothetical protein
MSLPCMKRKKGAAGKNTRLVPTMPPVIARVCPPPISLGSSVSILHRGVSLLAALTFEKAVIADHQHLKGDSFFKLADRNRFRESLAIPAGVHIWLAAFRGKGPFRLYFKRNSMLDLRQRTFDVSVRPGLDFLTFTYVAGHLAIQLVASRWKDKLNSRPLPKTESDGSFDSAAVQFWPPDGFAVSWPPSQYFDDKTIATFAERFDDIVSIRHRKK